MPSGGGGAGLHPAPRGAFPLAGLLLLAALGAVRCSEDSSPTGDGPDQTRYRLTVEGGGYGSLAERDIVVAVARTGTGTVVATDHTPIGVDGTFRIRFLPVLERDAPYDVDLFVDVNGNGLCDPPPDDSMWRTPFRSGAADTTLTIDFDGDYDGDACGSF